MKTILTSLFILMINLSFAQITTALSYIYVDAKGNTFELANGALAYTPSGTVGIYSGTTAKTVTLSKVEEADLQTVFKAAIATTADQSATSVADCGTVKYKNFKKYVTLYIKKDTESKAKLETSITALMNK